VAGYKIKAEVKVKVEIIGRFCDLEDRRLRDGETG